MAEISAEQMTNAGLAEMKKHLGELQAKLSNNALTSSAETKKAESDFEKVKDAFKIDESKADKFEAIEGDVQFKDEDPKEEFMNLGELDSFWDSITPNFGKLFDF